MAAIPRGARLAERTRYFGEGALRADGQTRIMCVFDREPGRKSRGVTWQGYSTLGVVAWDRLGRSMV
jgi:hypothetical protein